MIASWQKTVNHWGRQQPLPRSLLHHLSTLSIKPYTLCTIAFHQQDDDQKPHSISPLFTVQHQAINHKFQIYKIKLHFNIVFSQQKHNNNDSYLELISITITVRTLINVELTTETTKHAISEDIEMNDFEVISKVTKVEQLSNLRRFIFIADR
ncbi:hypothetical protein AB4356_19315 [Vibrio lentus]